MESGASDNPIGLSPSHQSIPNAGFVLANIKLSRIGAFTIALVFLFAGYRKIQASWFSESWSNGIFQEEFLIAVAFLEIALGLEWAIAKEPIRYVWKITFLVALSFLLVSIGTLWWSGWNCDCFGGIRGEAAIHACSLAAIFAGLWATYKAWVPISAQMPLWGQSRLPALSVILLLCWLPWVTVTHGKWRSYFGMPVKVLSLESLNDLSVNERGSWVLDLGQLEFDSNKQFALKVTNEGLRSVKLVGFWRSCSCVSLSGFPTSVEPSGACTLAGDFKAPTTSGHHEIEVELYTNATAQRKLRLTIKCVTPERLEG